MLSVFLGLVAAVLAFFYFRERRVNQNAQQNLETNRRRTTDLQMQLEECKKQLVGSDAKINAAKATADHHKADLRTMTELRDNLKTKTEKEELRANKAEKELQKAKDEITCLRAENKKLKAPKTSSGTTSFKSKRKSKPRPTKK